MADCSGVIGHSIALIGANGMLAQMIRQRAPKDWNISGFDLPDFDITDKRQVQMVLQDLKPQLILNCAAFTAVDACETQETLATRINAGGVANLAEVARSLGVVLVHVSTDYVFSGAIKSPYRENDPTGPISAYGRSKLKGEEAIAESGLETFYILRTSWLYGPHGTNFVETVLRLAGERDHLRIVADQIGSPTYTADLADALFNLLDAGADFGIYHFADEGECSWFVFAKEIVAAARTAGLSLRVKDILPISTAEYPLPAKRPAYSVLDKSKYKEATGKCVPDWRESLRQYFTARQDIK